MMPLVTVPESPSGDPIAMTGSPTTTVSELPRGSAGRLLGVDPQHRQVVARRGPDDLRLDARPVGEGDSATRPGPPSTTWLLVTTSPSSSIDEPDPVPPPSAGLDLDLHDARQHGGGDARDTARRALHAARRGGPEAGAVHGQPAAVALGQQEADRTAQGAGDSATTTPSATSTPVRGGRGGGLRAPRRCR